MTTEGDLLRTEADEPDYEAIRSRLRAVVNELREDGVPPAEVSSAFAYIATEFAFFAAPEPSAALKVVLAAVTAATEEYRPANAEMQEQESASHALSREMVGETLH